MSGGRHVPNEIAAAPARSVVAGIAPLFIASVLYAGYLVLAQPLYGSGQLAVINPTPMLYAVALIRTPRRLRLWLFPFVIAATWLASLTGAGTETGTGVELVGKSVSRAGGMFVFIIVLDLLVRTRLDMRSPTHVLNLAAAMAISLLARSLVLPMIVPRALIEHPSMLGTILRAVVPDPTAHVAAFVHGQAAGFLGVMAFAPPVLLLADQWDREGARARWGEAISAALIVALVGWAVFMRSDGSWLFVLLAAIVVTLFRVGFSGAAMGMLATAVVALVVQLNSLDGGAASVLNADTLLVQIFLATTTSMALLVGSALEQRRLFEIELEQAKQAAEETARSKARFLATMSHEIRSPLASLTLLSSRLRQSMPAGDPRAGMVDVIDRVGRHVLSLLNGVLSYARFEAVGERIEARPTDLARIVGETVATLSVQAVERGVALEVGRQTGEGALFTVDGARVGQVLTNLVSNACGHARSKVLLDVDVLGAAQRVRFTVTDDGVGIPPAAQAEIFEPYYRAQDGEKRGGTGLGLAISRDLVALMGGEIGVASVAGVSTTLWFELPLPAGGEP